MATTLLALHGFTQNGAWMRDALAPLAARFPKEVRVECPDGTHECALQSVQRLQSLLGGDPQPGPHLAWFDASDDGRQYRKLDVTEALLRAAIEAARARGERVGLLGFSQGANAVACLAALSAHGRFPALDFVVLIAGRVPRADALLPLFTTPLPIPSLHVWGSRDALAKSTSQALADAFAAEQREIAIWPGPHVIPVRGEGADAIVRFVTQHAG